MARVSRRVVLSCWILALVLLGQAAGARAQEPDSLPPPVRDGLFPAPEREPVVTVGALDEGSGKVQAQLIIAPAADAYIASNRATSNFGSTNALYVGYDAVAGFGAERLLMRFNISSLPSAAVIEGARVRLYLSRARPDNDSAMDTRLIRLGSSWSETTVTWNSEPARAEEYARTNVGTTSGWYEWDVTSLVRKWHANELPNYGFEIYGDERPNLGRERTFYSRETSTDFYPRLVIDYLQDTTPPTATVASLATYSPRSFTVSWSGSDNSGGSGIAYYDVQYKAEGDVWTTWFSQTTQTSATFTGQHNVLYQFRARAVDRAGNQESFGAAEAQTRVDGNPPVTTVAALPTYSPHLFTVSWSGSDDLSGIARYSVDYRIGEGPWQRWLTDVAATSAQFGASTSGVHSFRVQATDAVGNVEAAGGAEASTVVDVDVADGRVNPLPTFASATTFTVSWSGQDNAGGSGILFYDVQYRIDDGPWTRWISATTATSASFTAPHDGLYQFEARAADNVRNLEPFRNVPEASTIVDLTAPFVTTRGYLPVLKRNAP